MSSGLSMTSVNKIKELAAAREYSLAFDLIENQELSRSLNPQFLRLCGEVYVHMGEYEKARGTFIMARKLAPEAKRVMSDLVDLYYRAGYFELAETYYNIYMFDADSQNNETRQLAYIRAKALNKDNSEAMDELGEYYADNLDYDWSFELFLLYIKLGQTDKAKLLCRDYSASFKKSANAELMVQIIDGTEDVDKFFSVYATSSVTDDESETSPVWQESPVWNEEKKLLDADELRIHPKEPEITIMVDDDEELTLGDKRKFKKFIKEYEKAEKKAEEQQDTEEHSGNDEESEHVSADEPQASQEEGGKKSFFGKLFGKNKDKAAGSDEAAENTDEAKNEVVDEVMTENTDEAVEENENDVITETEAVAESADTDETEEISEEISEEVSGKTSEEEEAVIEEAAEDVTEEVLEEVLDDTADEITEEFLNDTVEETADSSVDIMVSLGNELDSALGESEPVSELASESESEAKSESDTEAASTSSFVFNEVELMPEEDDDLEVDDFLQLNDEEYIEIELKLDSESKPEVEEEPESEPEPEVEVEEEPESEPEPEVEVEEEPESEPEPEVEVEEEPESEPEPEIEVEEESESEPEPEVEVEEEPEPEPELEHNNRSVFSPEVNSRVKDDYPVFRSSLFPDYNNERPEVSNNFDEMMDEAQSKMHDNMLKEEQMQREAEQLLASLGINLDDIQPSVSENDEDVFSDLEMALDGKAVISRDELMKLIQIDDRKKDILRKLKEFR